MKEHAEKIIPKLERAIAQWDKRNSNPHAGALALQRLDEMVEEVETGKAIDLAICDNFNDRLRDRLLKAAGYNPDLYPHQ
jgi:hypothetical protein